MTTNLTQDDWDKKVIELSGSILQSWVWGEFQKSLGHKIYRFAGADFLTFALVEDLPFKKSFVYVPRGPLGNPQKALEDIKGLAEDHHLIFARIEPLKEVPLPKAVKEIQPSNNWLVSLDKNEEELLMAMRPKTRYNINLAQRKGVTVREGRKEDLLVLWQILLETATRHGFRLHSQNYYWQMWEILSPRYLKLFIAEYERKTLAAILVTIFSDTATFLHGGSAKTLKEAMAPYLLHWEAIKFAKRTGLKFYDFGGVGNDPSRGWSGITRFKKSFGGFEVVYPGSFDLIFSPLWYNVYKNARKLKRILSAGYSE